MELLKNVFYGYEVNQSDEQCRLLVATMQHNGIALTIDQATEVRSIVDEFYSSQNDGVFGGQITYGDSLFIACHIAALRPRRMFEFGVASGFSSALLLYVAEALKLTTGEVYLHSFDLDDGKLSGKVVGSFVDKNYPSLARYWSLHVGKTSIDWLNLHQIMDATPLENSLVFIDAGHNHPWPAMDLMIASRMLGGRGWALLQDVRMVERWIMDCIKHSVAAPEAVRGVEMAFAHWPGQKFFGTGLFYNMCTASLEVSDKMIEQYKSAMKCYAFETGLPADVFDSLLR